MSGIGLDPLVRLKFQRPKRKLSDEADQKEPKKAASSSGFQSAEQKFDAIFGSTGSFSSSEQVQELSVTPDKLNYPVKRNDNSIPCPRKTEPVKKVPKGKSKMERGSPFALAFGCVESDDDDESTFVDDANDETTAEDQWDTLMNEAVKQQPPKISSLRALARSSGDPEEPKVNSNNTKPDILKENHENCSSDSKAKLEIDFSPIKPEKESILHLASNSKTNDAGKEEKLLNRPFREKRFFKSKAKVEYQEDSEDPFYGDFDDFKKPTLPKLPNKKKVAGPIRVPVSEKLSDIQLQNIELADDLRFYLDGVKPSQDISSRALSAVSYAKRLGDAEFRNFLASKKLGPQTKAHNFGQFIVLHLSDACSPEKTTASFALASALALHKVCTDKKIGCSKYVLALVVRLMKLVLQDESQKDLIRIQRDADIIMKKSKKPEEGWCYKSVASETIVQLCTSTKKDVFNTICIYSGMLKHLVDRLIQVISVTSTEEVHRKTFEKVFTAFEAQTKGFPKAQEFVAGKTKFLEVARKFLDLSDPGIDLKQGGYADRITMHLIILCGESEASCYEMTKSNYLSYILDMIVKFPDVLNTQDEKKHSIKVGVAILLNLTTKSPSCRLKMQQKENFKIIINVLNNEMKELKEIHDGDVSMSMSKTALDNEFGNDIKGMTDEDKQVLGRMVNKADAHVKGCMTVAYCAIMLAQLIKANEFILDDISKDLKEGAIKYSLDCFDEVDNILKLSGKEDDASAKLMIEARETFSATGLK